MVLFLATTCVESMSWTQLGSFTPLYLRELRVSEAAIPGWVAAMSSLGWVIALPLAPFWGVWADRYSRKAVIVRSAVFEAAIFAGWAFATGPWTALAFRCLNGLIVGNTGVMLAVQASVTPKERLGLAIGVVGAGSQVGRAVGPALGALLIHLVDVRGMLLVDAALSLAMAGLLTAFANEPERERPTGTRVLTLLREAFGEIRGHPLIWRMFVALTLAQTATWFVYPYLPIYITRLASGTAIPGPTAIGLVLSATGLLAAVASPVWGRLVDRVGHIRLLSVTSVLTAAGLLGAGFAPGLGWLAAALLGFSVFSVAFQVANMALLARAVSPARRGAVLGQVLFPFYVAGLVGPPVGSVLFALGRPQLFAAAALVTLAPLGLLASARRALR